jgi:hypothetical protein
LSRSASVTESGTFVSAGLVLRPGGELVGGAVDDRDARVEAVEDLVQRIGLLVLRKVVDVGLQAVDERRDGRSGLVVGRHDRITSP